ncbi:MAG: hypothetical protein LBB98_06250 [Treponema sp.]|jgi:hypothetical protein|nr:hypothetical protein [Treponema sp.]
MRQESNAWPENKGGIDPAAMEAEIAGLFSPLISTALGGKPSCPARDNALTGDHAIPQKNIWRL